MACTVFVTTTLLGGHTRMPELKQYSVVCVRQLLHQPEHYNGWRVNQRAPQVGDKGTIVDILRAPGIPVNYVVECSGQDGVAIWLGDFTSEELEAEDGSPNKHLQPTPR
jgi:hypothetical protein